MKKNLSNLLFITLILLIGFEILKESTIVLDSVRFSFNIWINNIFPSLFPFFIISNLLIALNFHEILGNLLKGITYKLFKVNKYSSFIIILSMLSGFPSSSKNIIDLYDKNLLDEKTSTKLLTFTHFSNPLFVLGTVSTFVGNKELGFPILICHYLGNFIIGLILRNYNNSNNNIEVNNKKEVKNFGTILTNSIMNSINTLLLILGTVTIFLVITTLLNHIFDINNNLKPIFNGLFEITNGLKYLENVDISSNLKGLIAVGLISFGGLSIHMQTITIISDTNIKYYPYFIARVFHSIISMTLFYLWKLI